MYAIVRVGNKQYRVEKGDTLLVDRMPGDEGAKLTLEPLLYRSDNTIFDSGDLEKVEVEAAVVGHERGKKIHGLKFKPKHGYKVRYGARADLTRIEIKDIKLLTRKPAAAKTETPRAQPAEPAASPKIPRAQPAEPAASPEAAAEAKPKTAPKPKAAPKPKPAAKKPAAKKPAAKKPAAKKPAAKKPAAKKENPRAQPAEPAASPKENQDGS